MHNVLYVTPSGRASRPLLALSRGRLATETSAGCTGYEGNQLLQVFLQESVYLALVQRPNGRELLNSYTHIPWLKWPMTVLRKMDRLSPLELCFIHASGESQSPPRQLDGCEL
jgi:hypothetical protein